MAKTESSKDDGEEQKQLLEAQSAFNMAMQRINSDKFTLMDGVSTDPVNALPPACKIALRSIFCDYYDLLIDEVSADYRC